MSRDSTSDARWESTIARHLDDIAHFVGVPVEQWSLEEWKQAAIQAISGLAVLEDRLVESIVAVSGAPGATKQASASVAPGKGKTAVTAKHPLALSELIYGMRRRGRPKTWTESRKAWLREQVRIARTYLSAKRGIPMDKVTNNEVIDLICERLHEETGRSRLAIRREEGARLRNAISRWT